MRIPWIRSFCLSILVGTGASGVRAELPGAAEAWRFEVPAAAGDLRHDSVYSITQDPIGFLWIGTENGLARYDGYGFKHYDADPRNDRSTADKDISYLLRDGSGAIWIGTWGGGLDRLDPGSETFTHYPADPALDTHLSDDRVQAVYEDSQGVIWVGTFAGGLARFDRTSETFTTFRHVPGDPRSLPSDRIWSIVEHDSAPHGSGDAVGPDAPLPLWIATSNGLALFDRRSESVTATWRHDPDDPASFDHDVVRALGIDRWNVLWAGTQKGLHRLDSVPRRAGEASRRFVKVLDTGPVNVIFEDSEAHLWVGTSENGLYLLDRSSGQFQNFRQGSAATGLAGNNVRTLFEDHSQILWVGTREAGLGKLDLKPRKFQHVTRLPGDPASLGGRIVRSLAEDAAGNLWVGTDQGLDRYDDAQQRFVHIPHGPAPGQLPGDDVHLIYLDRSGSLWVGVWRHGLSRYLGAGQGFETFRPDEADPSSLKSDIVTDMLEDRSGVYWIGSDRGLSTFDPASGVREHFRRDPGDPESLCDDLIWTVHESSEGVLHVGTDSGGLCRFDRAGHRFERFQHDHDDASSLSHNRVFAIHERPAKRLWIGTANGLDELSSDGTFRRHEEVRDGVLAILSDRRGRLWLSTYQGIARFDPATGEIKVYGVDESPAAPAGRASRGQLLPSVAFERRDGRFLFGGDDGFYCFDPERVVDNPHVPPVVLTGFRRFNEPVELGSRPPVIEFSHRDNFFELEFAALDFTRPGRNRYRYRLEGFDPGWSEAGERRFAAYTDVDPGNYVFRVQGSNSDGVWNEEGLTVEMRITPPWWMSLGARFLGAAILILLAWLIYQWQIGRHRRRERELQRRIDESHTELRRSEARYRKLFERNLAGVVRATTDGRILDCNDAFARIFGYTSRQECRRRHRLDFAASTGSATLVDELRAHGSHETSALARDGSQVTLLWNANVVMDETSEGLVIEGTVIDISERQRIEERMRREQKLESLEVLAGGIAHDFNNLLVGILGNAELARLELPSDSPILDHLRDIESTAHRAANLSKKMLAYSGKGRFVIRTIDLSSTVDDALSLLSIPENVRILRSLDPDLPAVQADVSQLHQMLSNLVSNAAEAIDEDLMGTIHVTTGARHCSREYLAKTFLDQDLEEGLYVFLEVRDDGSGIDPEAQAKIFDPFYTTRFPGRGLGLPVVLGIMRGHRGALEIKSAPGRGTTVRALLPVSAEAVTGPIRAVDPSTSRWRGSGMVLIVDDETVVRRIAGQMLEILGFEVLTAGDGDEGVALFERHQDEIVLVVLDLTMPRMSGEAAFQEIRRIRSDAKVLLASGYEKQRATEAFEGLAGFIQKPFHLKTLREKVRRALEG